MRSGAFLETQTLTIEPAPKSELETWRETRASGAAVVVEPEAPPPPAPPESDPPPPEPVQPKEAAKADDDLDRTGAPSKRQQYINELIRKQTIAEMRAQQLEQELQALKTPGDTRPAPESQPATRPKPTEDEIGTKYRTHAEFVEDLADWKFEQREAARTRAEQASKAQQTEAEAVTAYNERLVQARTALPDLDEVLARPLPAPLTRTIGDFLLTSPVGPQLAYHLSTHHDDYTRIRALPVGRAWAELGKLETSLEKATTPAPAASPQISKAPDPVRVPVAGAVTPSTSLDQLASTASLAEWRNVRRRGGQK